MLLTNVSGGSIVGSRTEGLGQCGTVGRWDVVWGCGTML